MSATVPSPAPSAAPRPLRSPAPSAARCTARGAPHRLVAVAAALALCTCPLSPAPASAAAVVLPAAGGPSAAVVLLAGAAPPAGAAADGRTPRSDYTWPTGGPAAVLEDFDPPAVVWGSGHRGVDLALSAGSPVLAAGAGTVVFAGMVAGRPVVSIDHSDGIRTTYEPVAACVSAGDAVGRGQVIGTLVAGHRSDGVDALHWGARTGPKTYVNPLRLLRPAVIRLKPVQ